MNSLPFQTEPRITLIFVTFVAFEFAAAIPLSAQVSPEEHAKHHPEQAKAKQQTQGSGSKSGDGVMGGGQGGMMGGEKGGMMKGGMGGMMEKMGAPKPKELYPSLMSFPSLSETERVRVKELAHRRMQEGATLLAKGLDDLAEAAPTNDYASMQVASARMRQGLAQFESGLAAHRAIDEGKSPQNTALNWYKREMNLVPMTATQSQEFSIFGMSFFHAFIMLGLILFATVMILMYFFKMQRVATLLKGLTNIGIDADAPDPNGVTRDGGSIPKSKSIDRSNLISETQSDSCCDDEADCSNASQANEPSEHNGLLPMEKRKLCRLRVAKIISETDDTKTFRLVGCHGGALPFSFLPGQFLTFTLPVGNKPIKRSYTISSSPTQGYYCEVTVKREKGGAGSCYLHDQVSVGDTLHVKAPSGRFTFAGKEADNIVLISGGVGITPMMSITRALTDMCWPGGIYFIVACHDIDHFIFRSELETLQQQNDNLHVHAAISELGNDQNGYRPGRINKSMLSQWVPAIESKRIHICGPQALMDAVNELLSELSVPSSNIHTESFGSTQKRKPRIATKKNDSESVEVENAAKITFAKSKKTTPIQPDETILEAGENIAVDIEYSCRVGTCGECAIKLLSGDVEMEVDDGLEPSDKDAGMILACQAKTSEDVAVDA